MILLLAVSTFVGLYSAVSLKKRAEQLRSLLNGIHTVERGILCGGTEIGTLFKRASETGGGCLFGCVASSDGDTTARKYENAKKRITGKMFFDKGDWIEADRFFSSVGRTDADGQVRLCAQCAALISARLEDAEEKYRKFGTVYSRGGILVGIFIVILLI